jgi:hypothetical protein
MATTIKLKNGSGAPAASDLVQGEPAFDLTNKRLYTENGSGAVIEVGSNPSSLSINGTAVTATAAEINVLDGITSSTAELNILDGVTATTAELNYVDGVTSNIQTQLDTKGTASNLSDLGVTASASELNTLDGITATTAELNVLDGVTAFVDEDNMSSNSATSIPSQQSVKAYVDSQTGGGGATLSGLSDTNVTSPVDAALLFYDTGTSKWIDNVVSGHITIADTGVASLNASLNNLTDVNLSVAATDGQTLVFDSGTSKFIAGTSGAGLDGGFANSTYLTAQNFNGGGA